MKRLILLTLISVFLGSTTITSAYAQDKNSHETYDKVLKEYVFSGMVDYAKLKKTVFPLMRI